MVGSVDGVLNRIEEIQQRMKGVSSFSKPDQVKEFENMLKEKMASVSLNAGNSVNPVDDAYHPFLQDSSESSLNIQPLTSSNSQNMVNTVEKSAYTDKQQMIRDAVSRASEKYGISPDLINAVIRVESAFDPNAVSHAGAQGLMQLMPQTAKTLGVENSFDIYQNIDGGTKYLRQLLDNYQGDLDKSLAAYNAGPHRVAQYGGVPDIEETQNYVLKVKNYYLK